MAEKNLKIGKGSETGVKSGDELRSDRLDMFAGERISDLDTERAFRKFCEVECGWGFHEIHNYEEMGNALKAFVKENPGVYKHNR